MAELNRFMFLSRIRSSSLIEVTISLVIISMIFSISIAIYLNVQGSGFSVSKLAYAVMLDQAYNETMKTKDFRDKEFQYEEVTLFQTVKASAENTDLKVLRLEIRNSDGELLGERKYLLYVPS